MYKDQSKKEILNNKYDLLTKYYEATIMSEINKKKDEDAVVNKKKITNFKYSVFGVWTVSYTHLDVYKRQLLYYIFQGFASIFLHFFNFFSSTVSSETKCSVADILKGRGAFRIVFLLIICRSIPLSPFYGKRMR